MSTQSEFSVAVVGATGLVGEAMLQVLEERKFPVSELYAVASSRSRGKAVSFKGRTIHCRDLESFDFSQADIGLFSPGAEVSRVYAPQAAAAGCVVIDNTSEFRYEDDIPLVVPEVNPHAIALYKNRGIIANPNCSTDSARGRAGSPSMTRWESSGINVATYQSVRQARDA